MNIVIAYPIGVFQLNGILNSMNMIPIRKMNLKIIGPTLKTYDIERVCLNAPLSRSLEK